MAVARNADVTERKGRQGNGGGGGKAPGGVQECRVAAGDDGIRLDRWFRRHFPGLSHGALSKMLRTGQIRLDGRRVRPGERVRAGQRIRIPPLPAGAAQVPPRERRRRAERPLSDEERRLARGMLLYEDDFVIVLNKPAGLATQGGPGIGRHVDRLAAVFRRHDEDEAPRLVHRLDRDTSGVLVLARDARSAAALARAFKGRAARKLYWALVRGVPKGMEGTISAPLAKIGGRAGERVEVSPAGRPARTAWRRIERAGRRAAWLALEPLTGRTHQLRAHLAHIGHPIIGDGKYGGREAFPGGGIAGRLHLHARRIRLPHPGGEGVLDIRAPLPPHMRESWELLGFDARIGADEFGAILDDGR